ncbi:hypothetical protein MJO28_014609 [Puccinia striiformis f. sp. tritici]|uniref:Uncharacterized protein n=1 Tax=Puccinia striiformis f. sp. tritici TaxID=168172 RepID=A0ACC0DW44_9BASI|nr:hypothetical protein MJO28_014609 [Puccinia striiformis f. sp. tritici]
MAWHYSNRIEFEYSNRFDSMCYALPSIGFRCTRSGEPTCLPTLSSTSRSQIPIPSHGATL